MVDKLIDESTENIDEVKITEMALTEGNSIECNSVENIHNYCSCKLYIVLFSIIFTANIAVGTYFICFHRYLKNMLFGLSLVLILKQQFYELMNRKSQTNRDQKWNLLFLQRHN